MLSWSIEHATGNRERTERHQMLHRHQLDVRESTVLRLEHNLAKVGVGGSNPLARSRSHRKAAKQRGLSHLAGREARGGDPWD